MKKLLSYALTIASPAHHSQSVGQKLLAIVIQLLCSAFFAVFVSLITLPVAFIGIVIISMIVTESVFTGIGIAWNNTLTVSMVCGAVCGIGFFLFPYVGKIFMGDNLDERKNTFEKFKATLGFENAEEFSSKNFIIMANSDLSQALVLWNGKFADKLDYTILTPDNIIESTVYIDDMVVSKVTTGTVGSLTGAAVGGLLTGGTGAIVGAIAGKRSKSKSEVRVRKISINLTMKDPSKPHAELIFHKPLNKNDKGLKKGDWVLKHYIDTVNHWQAVMKNIMAIEKERDLTN
jgi:hypothetical protein